jgi:uncharacterized protein (DUF302 family)
MKARARIVDALKSEGFGVLTEIDVKSTLKAKLDREFRLGIGLLLPCDVCVWEEEGGSVVSIARPEAMFELVNRQDVQPVAREADQRLRRASEQVASSA